MTRDYRNVFLDDQIIIRLKEADKTLTIKDSPAGIKYCKESKPSNKLNLKLIMMALVAIIVFQSHYYFLFIFLLAYFILMKKPQASEGEGESDTEIVYKENILKPILAEICPGTSLDYSPANDYDVYEKLLPRADKYYSDCHIQFAFESKTEFSNMTAYHYRSSSKGKRIYIEDFDGQVMLIRQQTKLRGHIRIFPKKSYKGEDYNPYLKKLRDEREIISESLSFNENYAVFATDDFYTKLILDPSLIERLNAWSERMNICLYISESIIAIAFDSKASLFPCPSTINEVKNLTLVGEYERVRYLLGDYYELINIIRDKL